MRLKFIKFGLRFRSWNISLSFLKNWILNTALNMNFLNINIFYIVKAVGEVLMDVEEDKVSIQKLKFTNFIFYRNSSLKIFISPRSYVGYIFWVGLFAEMLKIYDF